MTIDKASEKSIRLTALDANGEVKVFLIMVSQINFSLTISENTNFFQSSIDDSNKLFNHLQERLEREIAAQKRKKSSAAEDFGGI